MKPIFRQFLVILYLLAFAATASARSTGGNLEPFAADYVVTKTNENGQPVTTTSRFYRDSQGRTRLEEAKLVTIMDPVAAVTIYLFPEERTYLQQSWAPAPGEPERAAPPESLQKTEASLGSRSIEGWITEGRQYTIVIPANSSLGNKMAVTKRVSLWLSQDLKIPVTTEIDDPLNGPSSHRYTNIVAGSEPDPSLFRVGPGYVIYTGPAEPVQLQRCSLRINPDPLILNSFGPFLGRGTQVASTNANRGCRIVGWAAIWEYPLQLTILTPLGLPTFSVRWSDNGGPVSRLPWVALGDIAFVAANSNDTTTKDALVVLTVWY